MTGSITWAGCALALAITMLGACNLVTGADDIRIRSRDDGDGAAGGGAAGGGSSGTPPASSGSGDAPPVAMEPADGVEVEAVKIYQGTSRALMEGGQPATSTTPVVAGKDALFRVFYATGADYDGAPLTARITIGGDAFDATAVASGGSDESVLASTLNVEVPGSAIAAAASWRVDVLQPQGSGTGANAAAGWPAAGADADLGAESSGGKITITLVPVQYNADGSGRLPDTSAAQLELYHQIVWGMYPLAEIDFAVHAPMPWSSPIAPNGGGWDALLNAVADLRAQDNAPIANFYYGIFANANSFWEYCGAGCVAGLASQGGPFDSWSHAAVGVGFTGAEAPPTAAHEIGHTVGLGHAPCGVAGEAFPYPNASIGAWGYDLTNQVLFSPAGHSDVMSYCSPRWMSDYNFTRLFDSFAQVNGAAALHVPADRQNLTYDRVAFDADGVASWLEPIVLAAPPMTATTTVVVESEDGAIQVTGHLYERPELGSGVVFVARAPGRAAPRHVGFAALGHVVALGR
jgi:peptidase M66-like protein